MAMFMINTLRQMINDDIGFEDITTNALISPDLNARAEIVSREKGIVAGLGVAELIFNEFGLECSLKKSEGNMVLKDDILLTVEGNARALLTVERTVLNFMMRMSGIATLTSKMVEKARKVNKNIIIAGTRKTTPGLQFFEKSAIKIGGGDTHRFRLDDCVMIKDNHIALVGDLAQAIDLAQKKVSFTKKIEVEVETLEGAITAAEMGVDIIMLDNMVPEEIIIVINTLKEMKLRENVLIEASGGINSESMLEYAKTGVDIISMGFLTHSAPTLDLSLEINL
jgi:nicotinate-nucleotide pyrophosphorylase (carboxylating)